jgi:hypothetical protein
VLLRGGHGMSWRVWYIKRWSRLGERASCRFWRSSGLPNKRLGCLGSREIGAGLIMLGQGERASERERKYTYVRTRRSTGRSRDIRH